MLDFMLLPVHDLHAHHCHIHCRHTLPPHLEQELAVMVARSRTGSTQSFPVVETIQKNSICHVTEAPAQISTAAREKAAAVAEQAVATLEGSPALISVNNIITKCTRYSM